MGRRKLAFITAILALLNIFFMFKINMVENSLKGKIQQQEHAIRYLEGEINSIYTNVDEKLKKEASILSDYIISFGESFNTDNYTVPVNISISPKEFSDNLIASIEMNNNIYPMQKSGTSFEATGETYIFDEFLPKVILEEKGVQKIEILEDYRHYNLKSNYILDLFCHFKGSESFSLGKLKYNGNITVEHKELKNNSIERISVIRELNGKMIDERELKLQDDRTIALDESIELNPNDKFSLYLKVTDKYGLKYKYIALYFEVDSDGKAVRMRPEWTYGSVVEISDKNGKLLHKPEFGW